MPGPSPQISRSGRRCPSGSFPQTSNTECAPRRGAHQAVWWSRVPGTDFAFVLDFGVPDHPTVLRPGRELEDGSVLYSHWVKVERRSVAAPELVAGRPGFRIHLIRPFGDLLRDVVNNHQFEQRDGLVRTRSRKTPLFLFRRHGSKVQANACSTLASSSKRPADSHSLGRLRRSCTALLDSSGCRRCRRVLVLKLYDRRRTNPAPALALAAQPDQTPVRRNADIGELLQTVVYGRWSCDGPTVLNDLDAIVEPDAAEDLPSCRKPSGRDFSALMPIP